MDEPSSRTTRTTTLLLWDYQWYLSASTLKCARSQLVRILWNVCMCVCVCVQIGGYDLIDLDRAGLGYDEEIIGMDGTFILLTEAPPHAFLSPICLSQACLVKPLIFFPDDNSTQSLAVFSVLRRDCRRLCVLCLEVARLSRPSHRGEDQGHRAHND